MEAEGEGKEIGNCLSFSTPLSQDSSDTFFCCKQSKLHGALTREAIDRDKASNRYSKS